ncbi:hypothetical protein KK083_05335 [Fulvivirgaceae bacterium PWU4]|uniref:Uncharacterized protein n=1 Tax=Chryseosolibacter histidini TaxID=2782349 RepID=A0AAP2DJC3_9BACT|nr:hypothetical protein [Chryseosolibacter histidini]MBT1696287.1 hypothetical protein [Chryseosolibacter histidini]
MKPASFFLIMIALSAVVPATAQKQLVLLKNEKVVLRLYPGDEFVFKLKNERTVKTSYINNLFENGVKIHRDTIPYYRIERIYFKRSTFANRIGSAMVVLGTGLFLIDQLNVTVIQGEEPSLDNWVSTVSLSALGVGLPMMLIKKKSQRINYKYRLLTVGEDSPFYRPDTRNLMSPY